MRRPPIRRLAAVAVTTAAALVASPPAARARGGWLKGQLHCHSSTSGDSSTPPADVLRWYGAHGYDFVVFTDHNAITRLEGPLPAAARRVLALPGVELTRNHEACEEPAPPPDGKCRVHMNGLLLRQTPEKITWAPPPDSLRRVDLYARQLDTIKALEGLAMLNHPTWQRGVDRDLMIKLARRGLRLLEIANTNFEEWERGSSPHPSTEELWDAALTAGFDVWGVAGDDAHHYFDAEALAARNARFYPAGEHFVMVRAGREAGSIRRALARGDFYASTGVLLERVVRRRDVLALRVAGDAPHHFVFIGEEGRVLAEADGVEARFTLEGQVRPGAYVRAVVTGPDGRKAWVQPIRLRARAPRARP